MFFGVMFAAVVFAAVYAQLAPFERVQQSRDNAQTEYGEKVLTALNAFYQEKGRYPWTDDLGSDDASTPLSFMEIGDPIIGVCKDSVCSAPGELADFFEGLFPRPVLHGKSVVGHPAENAPLYYCFVPNSENRRKQVGNLKAVNEGKLRDPSRCTARVNWEEDVCYVCFQ